MKQCKLILYIFVSIWLFGCSNVLTTSNITEHNLTEDIPKDTIEPAAPAQSSDESSLPLNQFPLEWGANGISWQTPDGLTHYLDPNSVAQNTWGIIRNNDGKPVMAYLWSTGIDSVLALSIEGANSQTVSLAENRVLPNKLFYYGVWGDVGWNPMEGPAIFLRAVGRRNTPAIGNGERVDFVSVDAANQDKRVAALENKVDTFVNNLNVRTFHIMRGEHHRHARPSWVHIGCNDPNHWANNTCPGETKHLQPIYTRSGDRCGYGYFVLTCTKKVY